MPKTSTTTATFTTPLGTQWWVSVNPETGHATIVVSRPVWRITERYDLNDTDRIALVRALSGKGD